MKGKKPKPVATCNSQGICNPGDICNSKTCKCERQAVTPQGTPIPGKKILVPNSGATITPLPFTKDQCYAGSGFSPAKTFKGGFVSKNNPCVSPDVCKVPPTAPKGSQADCIKEADGVCRCKLISVTGGKRTDTGYCGAVPSQTVQAQVAPQPEELGIVAVPFVPPAAEPREGGPNVNINFPGGQLEVPSAEANIIRQEYIAEQYNNIVSGWEVQMSGSSMPLSDVMGTNIVDICDVICGTSSGGSGIGPTIEGETSSGSSSGPSEEAPSPAPPEEGPSIPAPEPETGEPASTAGEVPSEGGRERETSGRGGAGSGGIGTSGMVVADIKSNSSVWSWLHGFLIK